MSQINGKDSNTVVDYRIRQLLERLSSLKENINWDIEEERGRFIRELYPLTKDWTGQLPHIRDIFQPKEIDRLFFDVIKFMSQYRLMLEGSSLINFVIRTGYKDEPELDEDGESSLSRSTPVHFAAASWFPTINYIVRQLFKVYHRFDVNYADQSGLTHFHVACMYGCSDVVEKFLEAGQDPNCLWTLADAYPLYLAVRSKREKVIELLLRRGADPDLANAEGQTLLHVICRRAQDDAALSKFFKVCDDIRQSIEIDARDNKGNTPLHLALLYGNEKEAELLLRRGADPNSANVKGSSPLHLTCRKNPDEGLTERFLKMCDEIQLTVEIDARDNEGNTPLQLALYYGNDELVELLVRRGADPSLANLKGLTALHFCRKNQIEMLFEVSEKKHCTVEVDAQDNEGNTPLHLAMYNVGWEKEIVSLLGHGASPNIPNNEGWTPLHLVCRKKDDYGPVERFFKICDENNQKVKVDAKDELGRTPLEWAVARCWPNIVHVLLDHGADLSNFVFPAASHFDKIIMGFKRISSKLKLQLISGALSVIETLEKRGYQLQQSDVVTIMKLFANNVLFQKSANLEKSLCDDEVFAQTAKQILITPKTFHCNKCGNNDEEKDEEEEEDKEEENKEIVEETKKIWKSSSLSLYDLISMRSKQLTSMVYYEAARAIDSWELSYDYQNDCVRHLCEKLSRQFFQSRTLHPFWELIHERLPLECCEMIIKKLRNEDLLNIFLAVAGQN